MTQREWKSLKKGNLIFIESPELQFKGLGEIVEFGTFDDPTEAIIMLQVDNRKEQYRMSLTDNKNIIKTSYIVTS